MRIIITLCVTCSVSAMAACGKRVPEPSMLTPGTPHVTWVIMSGNRDNPDRDFVCQSNPPSECVIPASTPDNRVFSDTHFYYHGAGAETKYTGSIVMGFFEGGSSGHRI